MVRIKICGITNLEDALLCARAGVDAIGFVFHRKSKRFVKPKTAQLIINKLPVFINKVAVITENKVELMIDLAKIGFDTFQLYFDIDSKIRSKFPGIKFIRAIRLKGNSVEGLDKEKEKLYDAYLIDAFHSDLLGGTGITVDWELACDFVKKSRLPVILAGGLSPKNIKEAIKKVMPYGVDVSSGVEKEPGKKDEKKVLDFVHCVYGIG